MAAARVRGVVSLPLAAALDGEARDAVRGKSCFGTRWSNREGWSAMSFLRRARREDPAQALDSAGCGPVDHGARPKRRSLSTTGAGVAFEGARNPSGEPPEVELVLLAVAAVAAAGEGAVGSYVEDEGVGVRGAARSASPWRRRARAIEAEAEEFSQGGDGGFGGPRAVASLERASMRPADRRCRLGARAKAREGGIPSVFRPKRNDERREATWFSRDGSPAERRLGFTTGWSAGQAGSRSPGAKLPSPLPAWRSRQRGWRDVTVRTAFRHPRVRSGGEENQSGSFAACGRDAGVNTGAPSSLWWNPGERRGR